MRRGEARRRVVLDVLERAGRDGATALEMARSTDGDQRMPQPWPGEINPHYAAYARQGVIWGVVKRLIQEGLVEVMPERRGRMGSPAKVYRLKGGTEHPGTNPGD